MKQTLLITVLILFFVISCAAQRNLQKSISTPEAQKFSEMLYFCNTDLDMNIARLAKILRKKPRVNAYIIIYPTPPILEYAGYLVTNAKRMLKDEKIALNRVVFLKGGFRENTTAEFFLVPKGAVPPIPNPTVDEIGVTLKP